MPMRQVDNPNTLPGILEDAEGHLPPVVNRKKKDEPIARRIANGIKELTGKMFTELEANKKAPADKFALHVGDLVRLRVDSRHGKVVSITPRGFIEVLLDSHKHATTLVFAARHLVRISRK